MTELEKQIYDNFFTRYGSASTEAHDTIYVHALRPDQLDKLPDVVRYDKSAADTIARLEKEIDALKIYRRELCNRYNELSTAATVPGVKLIRERRYSEKKVYYKLIFFTHYIDSEKDVVDKTNVFKGINRNEAIKAYNDYVKKHPGILCSMDIEKSRWER